MTPVCVQSGGKGVMARAQRSTTRVAYPIKVILKGSKPPIWRRIQVPSATTLTQLHDILPYVLGWEGSYLYQFVIGGSAYGDPEMLAELDAKDARTSTSNTIVRGERFKSIYEDDFGDSWEHELRVEKILPVEKGKRGCPPEDCGRIWTEHPGDKEMMEGAGGKCDPEAFDRDELNTEQQSLTQAWR